METGSPRLSEVARHLVIPTGIVSTGFPQVANQMRKMNTPLDEWQRGLLTAVLGKRGDGQYACGIGGAVISIPRQSGKTYTIGALVFALCLANPGILVLWSAHRVRTHNETFKSMGSLAERKEISPFVSRVLTGAGTEAIEFTNGSRVLFGARESGFGRGFAKVDVLVLDEAQILTARAMEDMVPATNAAPNGLVLMMGTPPRPIDPGEVFTSRREAALSGDDEDVLYVELSADDNSTADDRKQWAKANPSYPHRTTDTAILRMKKLLGSVDSFRREALGIWDSESRISLFAPGLWEAGERSERPAGLEVGSLAIAVSLDLRFSAIVAGSKNADGVWVKPLHHGPGTKDVVDRAVELQSAHGVDVVIDGRGPGAVLIPHLERAGVKLHIASTGDVLDAFSCMETRINDGEFLHFVAPELDRAAVGAVRRSVGDRSALGRKKSEADISPLEASSLAAWFVDIGPEKSASAYEARGVMMV
ncbi:terminase large subunit [Arthrobacter phage 1191A]|nr:terminase large subunit [Arthrobacter phage 1191A]